MNKCAERSGTEFGVLSCVQNEFVPQIVDDAGRCQWNIRLCTKVEKLDKLYASVTQVLARQRPPLSDAMNDTIYAYPRGRRDLMCSRHLEEPFFRRAALRITWT